jgi:DNA transformation protein
VAVSESYLTFVLEQLAGVRAIATKRMFGGVGVYSGDAFFAILDNDTLFFKVDEALAPQYRRAGMPPFAPIPGKPPMQGYYQVPPGVLEDAEALAAWARQSVAVAVAAPGRAARRRRAPAGRPGAAGGSRSTRGRRRRRA